MTLQCARIVSEVIRFKAGDAAKSLPVADRHGPGLPRQDLPASQLLDDPIGMHR
jgi:hypothetical protein